MSLPQCPSSMLQKSEYDVSNPVQESFEIILYLMFMIICFSPRKVRGCVGNLFFFILTNDGLKNQSILLK